MPWWDRWFSRASQPSATGVVPTHVPMPTLDNKQLMELFKKDLGMSPTASMFGGWQGALSSRYRTGAARLASLQNAYGGTQDSVVWVFACISLIASTLASYPWRFVDDAGETVERPPPDLVRLLESPNPDWVFFDMVESVVTDLELVGNAYLLKNGRNALGQPTTLFRLRPDRVRIAVAADGTERGYVYAPPNGLMVPYDSHEVIHLRYPNPLDDHYGMGTVEAISQVLDQHTSQALHITGYFQNGSRLSGVLTIPETLHVDQFERLKQSYQENYAGPANAYKLLIAEGATDYKAITQTPVASGVVDLMQRTKDEILAGFGVPAPLLGGVMENANYKMEESQHIFLRAMIPRTRRFAERLTVDLARLWGVTFVVDAHANEPLEVKIAHAKEMLGAGATVNEARRAMGEAPSDDPKADQVLVHNNLIPLDIAGEPPRPGGSIPMEFNAELGAPPGGNGSAPNESELASQLADLHDQVAAPKGAPRSKAEAKVRELEEALESLHPRLRRRSASDVAAQARRAWGGEAEGPGEPVVGSGDQPRPPSPPPSDWIPPDYPRGFELLPAKAIREEARLVREHQARALRVGVDTIEPAMRRFFRAQRDRVLSALAQYGSRESAARMRGRPTRAKAELDPGQLFDADAENEALREAFLPVLDEVGRAALPMPAQLGAGLSWDLTNLRVAALRTSLGSRITRINDTTRQAISEQVVLGLGRGYSVPQIANGFPEEDYRGIMGVFDDATEYRAEMIARTESAFAFNGAQVADYGEAGTQWVEILDGTGDEACAEADGSIWSLDQYDADPLAHPNCSRCAVPSDVGPDGEATPSEDEG